MDKEKILKEQFLLIRVLGEGVYGKVYLIRDNATRKHFLMQRPSMHSNSTAATSWRRRASTAV